MTSRSGTDPHQPATHLTPCISTESSPPLRRCHHRHGCQRPHRHPRRPPAHRHQQAPRLHSDSGHPHAPRTHRPRSPCRRRHRPGTWVGIGRWLKGNWRKWNSLRRAGARCWIAHWKESTGPCIEVHAAASRQDHESSAGTDAGLEKFKTADSHETDVTFRTCLAILMLEVYYRDVPAGRFQANPPAPKPPEG